MGRRRRPEKRDRKREREKGESTSEREREREGMGGEQQEEESLEMRLDGWKDNARAGRKTSFRSRERERTQRRETVNTNGLQPVQCCINRA